MSQELQREPEERSAAREASRSTYRGGFRIGRIAGIELIVDWSLFIIFWLVALSLSLGLFPRWHPEWSALESWAVGIGAAVLFFVSILLHELAHALVARARGIRVPRITLFIFGGMAHIEQEARSPAAEFLIAIVGPLTSLVLGLLAIAVGSALASASAAGAESPEEAIRSLGPVTSLLLWLGPVNVLLGVFNLIPGFPLDGGRVFRALVWWITGSVETATRWSTLLGRAFAWVLIGIGVAMALGLELPIFGTGLVSGLWLVLIGWFLNSAAATSYRQFKLSRALSAVPVSEVMRSQLALVTPETTIEALVQQIMNSDQRSFPVTVGPENRELVGLVTIDDLRRVPQARWGSTSVAEIMTPARELAVVGPSEDAADVMDRLAQRDVDQLPVVERGRVLGLVRREDILKWLALRTEPHPT